MSALQHSFDGRTMYQPTLGRFLSRDPLAADGVDVVPNSGWFGDRLTMMRNLYGYVENNPVNRVDPSGLQSIRADTGARTLSCPSLPKSGCGGTCSFELRFSASIDPKGCGPGKPGVKSAKLTYHYSATNANCEADVDREAEYRGPIGHLTYELCDGEVCRLTSVNFPPGGFWPPYFVGQVGGLDERPVVPPPGRVQISAKCRDAMNAFRRDILNPKAPPTFVWEDGKVRSISFEFTLITICRCKTSVPPAECTGTLEFAEQYSA